MLCLFCRRLASSRRGSAAGRCTPIREYAGGFHFKKLLRLLVVRFRELSGAIFKTQVTQIFVNCVASFHQLVEFRAMRRGIRSVGLDHEYEHNCGCGKQCARDRNIHATHRNLFQFLASPAPETPRDSRAPKPWPAWPSAANGARQPTRERTL